MRITTIIALALTEAHLYFNNTLGDGGFGKFNHHRACEK